MNEAISPLPVSVLSSGLPKVVHHTWKHSHLHPHLRRCVDSFRKWNPEWSLRFWTDAECEQLIAEELPNFLPTYLGYPKGILRADIFRIVVLYVHGGVYADLDMECLRPLDEFLHAATGGEEDWEVLLNRDHPVHEDHIWHGGPMWMNAFMVAKPGAIYLGMLLTEFTRQLREGEVDESDPVMTTGPGLLTDIIGRYRGLAALGIHEIPWHWVHPLPNVQLPFEKKPQYEYLIRCRAWRDGIQPAGIDTPRKAFAGFVAKEPPFAAHYWWHSYIERCKIVNMLTRHGDSLLQSDAEIVERRLGDLPSDVCPQSLGETLCQFAERGGTRILLSGQSPPVGLSDLLHAAGAGLDWRVAESPGLVPSDGSGAWPLGEDFDLHIELSSGANGHPVSDETAFSTLREGGLYLRLEDGRDAKLNGSGTSTELRSLSGEYPIFEKRPAPGRETPVILHWLETPSTTPLSNGTIRSWEACHPSNVWEWRRWTMEGIERLIPQLQFPGKEHLHPRHRQGLRCAASAGLARDSRCGSEDGALSKASIYRERRLHRVDPWKRLRGGERLL